MYIVRVGWDKTDRKSIIEIDDATTAEEAERIAYGLSGEFFFEDGGKGVMGHPQTAEVIK
jgi:hypothetical protein